jgi:hypothetical protein
MTLITRRIDSPHGGATTFCLAMKDGPHDVDADWEDTDPIRSPMSNHLRKLIMTANAPLEIELVLVLPWIGILPINEEPR